METPVLVVDPLKLRKLRKDGGFTQERLAEKAGTSSRTVMRLEAPCDNPDIDGAAAQVDTLLSTISGLSRALGVSGFSLLKEIPDP